ncbi:MAG TPA: hypothetical protein VEN81_00760 [Planctomycetota bacterium]|nr:hypothetical protein [Planctomycetota bacterium]
MKTLGLGVAAAVALFLGGCGKEEASHSNAPSPAPAPEKAAKAYPLKTCLVSGEELGKMGEPVRIVYEGQEIKFCCKSCEPDFRKDPAKYLKKLQ